MRRLLLAVALVLLAASGDRTYRCETRPPVPVAPGVTTVVLSAPGLAAAARVFADVCAGDPSRDPRSERIRLAALPEPDRAGLALWLDEPGETRLVFHVIGPDGTDDQPTFAFSAKAAPVPPHAAAGRALESGAMTNDAQQDSMAEIGELWADVQARLFAEPSDLEGTKDEIARIRALASLLGGFEPRRHAEGAGEMRVEGEVFRQAVVDLLRSIAAGDSREARERFGVIEARSCTKCHLKFRWGVVDDLSRFPDLRRDE